MEFWTHCPSILIVAVLVEPFHVDRETFCVVGIETIGVCMAFHFDVVGGIDIYIVFLGTQLARSSFSTSFSVAHESVVP